MSGYGLTYRLTMCNPKIYALKVSTIIIFMIFLLKIIAYSLEFVSLYKGYNSPLLLLIKRCKLSYFIGYWWPQPYEVACTPNIGPSYISALSWKPKGHFTRETESPWPLHFKHSHSWKRRSRSKFTSHYAQGTNGVCECMMDVKSTWIPYTASNGSCFTVT